MCLRAGHASAVGAAHLKPRFEMGSGQPSIRSSPSRLHGTLSPVRRHTGTPTGSHTENKQRKTRCFPSSKLRTRGFSNAATSKVRSEMHTLDFRGSGTHDWYCQIAACTQNADHRQHLEALREFLGQALNTLLCQSHPFGSSPPDQSGVAHKAWNF